MVSSTRNLWQSHNGYTTMRSPRSSDSQLDMPTEHTAGREKVLRVELGFFSCSVLIASRGQHGLSTHEAYRAPLADETGNF